MRAETYTGGIGARSLGEERDLLACRCIVVSSSYMEQRYRQEPTRYARQLATYERLRRTGRVLTEVGPRLPLRYNWDLLPQWGLRRIPLGGQLGATGPVITLFDLRQPS